MPKASLNGGHSPYAPGASGYFDEVTEDRKVRAATDKYLRQAGWSTHDSSTTETSARADINTIVSKANGSGADYFISFHFNSGGGKGGVEVFYAATTGRSWPKEMGAKITASLSKLLGTPNRGVKPDTQSAAKSLGVLRHTTMAAILIEVCFLDVKSDADAYWRIGPDAIGRCIAECVSGKSLGSVQVPTKGWYKDSHGWWWENGDGSYKNSQWFNPSRGEWYWLGADGYAATGWTLIDGTWYYFAKAGEPGYRECQMVSEAWRKDSKGADYWLSGDGSMATSRWVDKARYYVGPDGAWDSSR